MERIVSLHQAGLKRELHSLYSWGECHSCPF